jgi:MoxR-like ATPase
MRERLIDNVARNVGPRRGDVIDLLLVCLLSEGHFLLEGESGAGKTMFFDAFARSFNMTYRKIPMTVDL